MGTRSSITAKMTDGTFKSVYCHWDGHLDHNGKILLESYNNQEKVEALLEHGDISSLGARCDKPQGHSFENKIDGCTVYYGRDRGETGTGARSGATAEESNKNNGQEFDYLWDGEKWIVSSGYFNDGELTALDDAIKMDSQEE